MIVENQPAENQPPPEVRRNPEDNSLDVGGNPYAQESSDEDDDVRQDLIDTRIFQFKMNTNAEYPLFIRGCDEVKAKNGFIWCRSDTERAKNIEKCSYVRPVPTRGNCVMCGRSGALGRECSNRCRYDQMTRTVIRRNARNRHVNFRDDPDLNIRRHQASRYRMMLTPERENIIDAVFFAEMMYKGVDDDQRNWDFFRRMSPAFKTKKHDNVLARLDRLEDPWVYTFPMSPECEWYIQLNFLADGLRLNLEEPLPGQKYRPT